MYLNKQTKKRLEEAVLALKVHGKRHGKSDYGSMEWHESWDDTEACHYAIQIMIGVDTDHCIEGLRSLAEQGKGRVDHSQAERWLWVLGLPVDDGGVAA